MIQDFDDFSLWVYFLVDEIWQQIAPLFKRPGPAPTCSDSELIAMALIGECRGGPEAGHATFLSDLRLPAVMRGVVTPRYV
jgi:hypothetical protein